LPAHLRAGPFQFPARLRPGPGTGRPPADRGSSCCPYPDRYQVDHGATSFAAGADHFPLSGVIPPEKWPFWLLRTPLMKAMLIITRSPGSVGSGLELGLPLGGLGPTAGRGACRGTEGCPAPATCRHRDLDWALRRRASRAAARSRLWDRHKSGADPAAQRADRGKKRWNSPPLSPGDHVAPLLG